LHRSASLPQAGSPEPDLEGFYAATERKGQADNDGYEPTITASTRNLGDRVEISIRDNGTGIPSEVKEQMFNPFFTTKPSGEGTGLGSRSTAPSTHVVLN
jgi:hypothetical protein